MVDVLEEILAAKRKSLQLAKERTSQSELERAVKKEPSPISFSKAIDQKNQISLIAEIKRKSPSAGVIRDPFDPKDIAKNFQRGGARALSILTDADAFGGEIDDIKRVREVSSLPILRKDFVFDPYQIVEARAYGANAILLIAEMLEAKELMELAACAREFQIEPLVEVFTAQTVPAALATQAKMIGINTRNLRTLKMNPENISKLSLLIPADRLIIAESGIKTAEDIKQLKSLPVKAVLVGESLLKQKDLEKAVRNLVEAGN